MCAPRRVYLRSGENNEEAPGRASPTCFRSRDQQGIYRLRRRLAASTFGQAANFLATQA
jgi:hypothetical protein